MSLATVALEPSCAPCPPPRTGLDGAGWPERSVPPPLAPDEVHVWRVRLPAEGEVPPGWPELLTIEEREGVARRRCRADARRALASRGCLRLLLGAYLRVPPGGVALVTSAMGKPALAGGFDHTRLEFNVSHSGDWIMLAFARGRAVGIDVERRRNLGFDELVQGFFSSEERAVWATLPRARHEAAFFATWTRKEAYLKALGVGLSQPLDSFTVPVGEEPTTRLLACPGDRDAPPRWQLAAVDPDRDHAAAVAFGTEVRRLQTLNLSIASPRGTATRDRR